jgi:hypothetical protein
MPNLTVDAADRMLPLVRRIVINVRARQRLVARKSEEFSRAADAETRRRSRSVVERLRAELAGYVAELKALDVEILDANAGLVGRRAEVHGRSATVVWRPGLPSFCEWFGEGETPADRRPLSEAPASAAAFDV